MNFKERSQGKLTKGQWDRRVTLFRAMDFTTEELVDLTFDHLNCKKCPVQSCSLKNKPEDEDWYKEDLEQCSLNLANFLEVTI